jgi:hypothetical protein
MLVNYFLKAEIALAIIFTASLANAADINNGKALHQAKCYQCHAEKSGLGNGDVIYTRPDRKAKDLAGAKRMISMCNTELRLDLFPEDEVDLLGYINQQFYKYQ